MFTTDTGKMPAIDIIIPAYNTNPLTLGRCLASIACQSCRDFTVTIVDDGSRPEISGDWWPVINGQRQLMQINVTRRRENGGPGVARQTGIDSTHAPFIVFMDADDTLNGSFALTAMLNIMTRLPDSHRFCMGSCVFDEAREADIPEQAKPGPLLAAHVNDMIWVFGKIYRRAFLDENGITFHPTSRANEDNGFNQKIRLLCDENHAVAFSPAHVYLWHETLDSITRASDREYSFGSGPRHSFAGYCENMAHTVIFARKARPRSEKVRLFAAECMANIYWYYVECQARSPMTAEANLEHARDYYKGAFAGHEPDDGTMGAIFAAAPHGPGLMPELTFRQFLKKLGE